ncbi:type I restriction-modification system subunit M [Stenotrophomonas maltophilia]|uniref:type I restriction-modification system subunit M n=1 Tax=Stenotrophomonas maltophilia TaxID=40324 RepID=UPI002D1FAB3F|nr:N-6 DNA methylase [Stenotrophomonas maltophilia]
MNEGLVETLGQQGSIFQCNALFTSDDSVALNDNDLSLRKPICKQSAANRREASETGKEGSHNETRDKNLKPIEQQFFNDLEKKLWTAADKLRSNLDAAVYKHVVLGLIFIKYVSDAFEERQRELREQFTSPNHDYYMDPDAYGGAGTQEYEENIAAELEVRDYYTEKNVFWVPVEARWQTLRDCAQLPPKAVLPWNKPGKDEPEEMRSVGWLIDNAMEAVERENARLKNVLNKDFARVQLESNKLAGLISHFSDTDFSAKEYKGQRLNLKSKDILGHVYEYFLGQFALAEGKKGGQYYTPKSIVTLIVEMLQPFKGRVYDPAMGSGGFFVQSEEFIEQHGGKAVNGKSGQISVYGQESNPTTWRLAAMNMAIRGIDFNFGPGPADTLLNDLHPDLRADFVMANPPFNMKEWWNEKLAADPRWIAGTPPQGNANFAWLQHMLWHLAPTGSMALLLANGSMSSNTNNEGEIRKRLIEDDYVECMVALPGQLFTNTQIPACIWFLTRDKHNGFALDKKKRDRRGEFLFIDARQLGYMKDRVLRDFTLEDIQKIADTFHAWQQGEGYEDLPGYCHSAKLEFVRKHEARAHAGALCGRGRAGRGQRTLCRQDAAPDRATGGRVRGECEASSGDQEKFVGVGLWLVSGRTSELKKSP